MINRDQGTQPISAASLPLPSGAATETTLSAISTKTPALGQALMAASSPVVIASNQSAVPVSGTFWQATQPISAASLPLPAGASTAVAQASTTSGQSGTLVQGAVTTAAPTYTTGKIFPLSLDTAGGLRVATHAVTQSGTWNVTVNAAIAAGTNAIGDVGVQYRANATGAASATNFVAAASTNPTVIKASAGRLLGYHLTNNATAVRLVKFHNQATAPTAGTGVVQTVGIPPNGGTVFLTIPGGIGFSTGIAITTVTGAAATDATAVAENDIVGTFHYA